MLDTMERDFMRGGKRPQKRRALPGKEQRKTEITVPRASKRVIRISEVVSVAELAKAMSLDARDHVAHLDRLLQVGAEQAEQVVGGEARLGAVGPGGGHCRRVAGGQARHPGGGAGAGAGVLRPQAVNGPARRQAGGQRAQIVNPPGDAVDAEERRPVPVRPQGHQKG